MDISRNDFLKKELVSICKKKNVPLVLDATFNTPYLMQPFKYGANIIVHSLTKWLGGHGIAIGGAIVNGGNFDWEDKEKFPTGAWCEAGNWVMFARYAGSRFKIDGGEVRILNDDEILAKILEPEDILHF